MKILRFIKKEPEGSLMILIIVAIVAIAGHALLSSAGYDTIPQDANLKCKIQVRASHYAVTQDGTTYEIRLGTWVLLDIPICGDER